VLPLRVPAMIAELRCRWITSINRSPASTRATRPAVLASQLQLPTAPGCSAAAAPGGAHLLLEDPGAATVV